MAICQRVSCVVCGYDVKPARLGLREDGSFDPEAAPREMNMRIDHIGGRGMLRVERVPLPVHMALGLRAMLQARLDQIDAELAAAGVVL